MGTVNSILLFALFFTSLLALSCLIGQNHDASAMSVDKGIFASNYTMTKISNTTDFEPMDWSHNGSFIIGGSEYYHLQTLDLQTGKRTNLLSANTTYQLEPNDRSVIFDGFSPARISYSDDQLLFRAVAYIDGNQTDEIFRYDIESSVLTNITDNLHNCYVCFYSEPPQKSQQILGATWMPDGNILLVVNVYEPGDSDQDGQELWLTDTDGHKMKTLVSGDNLGAVGMPDVSVDGKKVVMIHSEGTPYLYIRNNHVQIIDIETGQVTMIPEPAGDCVPPYPRMSANGELILFQTLGCRYAPGGGIDVMNAEGTLHESILPYTDNRPSLPVLSPDGTRLIFFLRGAYEDTPKTGLYIIDFAHPMPEFGLMTATLLGIATMVVVLVVYPRFRV
jgi:Tol biopolymer transport system component